MEMTGVETSDQREGSGTPTPEREEFLLWYSQVKKSCEEEISWLELFINVITYLFETLSLISALSLGFITGEKVEAEDAFSAGMYILLGFAVVFGRLSLEDNFSLDRRLGWFTWRKVYRYTWSIFKDFLVTVTTLVKPIRYWDLFSNTDLKQFFVRRMVARPRPGARNYNEKAAIQYIEKYVSKLGEIREAELEDAKHDLYEVYFYSIPFLLVQIYLLSADNLEFKLCSIKHVCKLFLILSSLLSAAKTTTAYQAATVNYEAVLHCQAFLKSRGANPMRVYPTNLVSIAGLCSTILHFATLVSRIYATAFLMALSSLVSISFLFSIFLVNLVMIRLFPWMLLPTTENVPLFTSTRVSYVMDRYINIFSNVHTGFHSTYFCKIASWRIGRLLGWNYIYIPMILWQILAYGVPATVFGFILYFLGYLNPDFSGNVLDSSQNSNTTLDNLTMGINTTLEKCPEVDKWYSASPFFRDVGNYLFSSESYNALDNTFRTFQDVFTVGHMIWFPFYCQIIYGFVYAYADLSRRKRDPATVEDDVPGFFEEIFPISEAKKFYNFLLSRLNEREKIMKVMVLTLLEKTDFYRFTRKAWIFPRSEVCMHQCTRVIDKQICLMTSEMRDDTLQRRVQVYLRTTAANPWTAYIHRKMFTEVHYPGRDGDLSPVALMRLNRERRLFIAFFKYLDIKMYKMTSDRIKRIFELVNNKEIGKEGIFTVSS